MLHNFFFCVRNYNYDSLSGRGRHYAYLHESSPPNSPLVSDKDTPVNNNDIIKGSANYNSDKIPFVSLAQNGDDSGFHPSVDDGNSAPLGRNIVARSMNIDDSEPVNQVVKDTKIDKDVDENVADDEEIVESTTMTEHLERNVDNNGENDDDDDAIEDNFDATVVELSANDFMNDTEVFKLLTAKSNAMFQN